MPTVGSPYSYSFEGQKTNVPLAVDAETGPEGSHSPETDLHGEHKSIKEVKGVYRRGGRRKRH